MLTTENSTELAPMTGPTTPYFYEFLDETKRKIAQIAMDYVIILQRVCSGRGHKHPGHLSVCQVRFEIIASN